MEANVNLTNSLSNKHSSDKEGRSSFFGSELFFQVSFAIISGILIALGWLLETLNHSTTAVVFYLFAFVIGGFFKAKEGITETIENKKLNVEILMILAAIGSAIIGYWTEGAILIFIFAVSGALETYTMNRSKKELTALMNLQPEVARLITDSGEIEVLVKNLKVGDHILIKPGEQIPADGKIIKGKTSVDESTISGESVPLFKTIDDHVYAGTMNGSGAITVLITKRNEETLFNQIVSLVQQAQAERSPAQQFIDRFEGIYVYVVLLLVGLVSFLPHYLLDWSWNETLYRACVFLVVASPCAVVASITPAALSAISNGARNGILIKGSSYLEILSNLKAVAFDKTGTLTKGRPEVTDFINLSSEKNREAIIQVAASIENQSTHPLATAIVKFAQHENIDLLTPEYIEDVPGYGIQGRVNGKQWKIGKKKFLSKESNEMVHKLTKQLSEEGKTIVFIEQDGELVGLFALKDIVRDESNQAIESLKKLGIEPIMLTGDNYQTAKKIASEIGISSFIADCLPNQKVSEIEKIKEKYGATAMVGDGINDAPSLAKANVGIAMGAGTDVALETADIVLIKDDLSKIASTISLSKRMNKIIKQNLIFSISIIVLLIISNLFQAIDLPLGVIGHEGSTILVILNSLRLLK